MKNEVSNLINHIRKIKQMRQVTHSSVGFQGVEKGTSAQPKSSAKDFMQELKDAISSGDDSIWRMWR
ncbi:hypothetical protein [Pedobacter heparinus]|uniref:hypothetical protein n=1 Tax=Pedobacter heparinus TaxID=984 RepID=UPI00292FF08F|nr:hypothetical protein [Pedobacter heparinus]